MCYDLQQVLELRGVSKIFAKPTRTFTALEDVSFKVSAGELVCLIGESGSGKSTLLQIIAGFERPSRGEVLYCGEPIMGPSPERLLVFQSGSLLPWLTVRQNLALSLDIAGQPSERAVKDVLGMMRLQGCEHLYPSELSGGMAQRVAIGRALISDAKLLLLDEPFSAVDAFTRMALQEELQRLWQERGLTIIMVTHEIDEAVFLGTRIIALDSRPGRVAFEYPNIMPYPRDRTSECYSKLRAKVLDRFLTNLTEAYA